MLPLDVAVPAHPCRCTMSVALSKQISCTKSVCKITTICDLQPRGMHVLSRVLKHWWGMQREVFAKLGVSSLEELGLEDWSQLLSPGSPNSVSGFHQFEGAQQVSTPGGFRCTSVLAARMLQDEL